MPRKQVYGKRANAALCSTVTKFNASSSPTRLSPRNNDDVADIAAGLQSVKLDRNEGKDSTRKTARRIRKDVKAVESEAGAGLAQKQETPRRQGLRKRRNEPEVKDLTQDTPSREREDSETHDMRMAGASISPEYKESRRRGRKQPSIVEIPSSPSGASSVSTNSTSGESSAVRSDADSAKNGSSAMSSEESSLSCTSSDVSSEDSSDSDVDPDLRYTQSLLQLCRDPSGRKAPSEFSTWSSALESRLEISKIAEASYGEVYRLSVSGPSPLAKSEESVLKLIPLRPGYLDQLSPEDQADYQWMSTIASVTSEVQLLQRMASTPGFTNFREVRVVQGRPSKFFCKAWTAFNKAQPRGKKSQFPDPGKKISYAEDQLWAVIEMQDAGSDLEHIKIGHVWGLWDVFWGVALAVAKAEESARFEHRDLHLGNICVRPRNASRAPLTLDTTHGKISFTNLETTIIDYTLSRADLIATPSTPSRNPPTAFLDLDADPTLFEADEKLDYQYAIYRNMRSAFFTFDPLDAEQAHPDSAPTPTASVESWKDYNPVTNVVWLHFILHQLLVQLPPLEKQTWECCGVDMDERDERTRKKAARLERRLRRLNHTLDVRRADRTEDEMFASAGEIVEWAVIAGWLGEGDVLGEGS